VSFLCSLLEAALLSLPQSHIMLMVEKGSRTGERLQRMKGDVDRPLAAILTLNTFAHTLGAAGVGAEAAMLWGDAWVGAVSFVVTILILVFSEIIPKTLGAVHAKALAGFTAWTVHVLIVIFQPVVTACNAISRIFAGKQRVGGGIERDEVRSLALLAASEGAIDHSELHVIGNLMALREIPVERVMTPRTVVFTLRADQTVKDVLSTEPTRFARVPIVRESLDDVIGLIHRYELFEALKSGRTDLTLGELSKPIHVVPAVARLATVLETFIERREHLFLVVDEYGGVAGIVTLEDVLETLLGVEIVDETDVVADMRELAQRTLARSRRIPQ